MAALIKVQSFFRALLARKKVNKIRSETYAVHYNENGDVVNYDNPSVQNMRAQKGPFVYSDFEYEETLGERELRPMQVLENKARYQGEWLVN